MMNILESVIDDFLLESTDLIDPSKEPKYGTIPNEKKQKINEKVINALKEAWKKLKELVKKTYNLIKRFVTTYNPNSEFILYSVYLPTPFHGQRFDLKNAYREASKYIKELETQLDYIKNPSLVSKIDMPDINEMILNVREVGKGGPVKNLTNEYVKKSGDKVFFHSLLEEAEKQAGNMIGACEAYSAKYTQRLDIIKKNADEHNSRKQISIIKGILGLLSELVRLSSQWYHQERMFLAKFRQSKKGNDDNVKQTQVHESISDNNPYSCLEEYATV